MNKVTRVGRAGIASTDAAKVVNPQLLDALEGRELEKIAEDVLSCMSDCYRHWKHEAENAVAKAEAVLADPQCQALMADLEAALQPATSAEIRAELAVLLFIALSNHKDEGDDANAFARLAANRVAAKHPSRLILAAACRQLIDTKIFRPAISEILKAMRDVAEQLDRPVRAILS